MLPLGTYLDSGYKVALFFHVVAVVIAFGPTFGYAFFASMTVQFPKAAPAILSGIQRADRYLVNPGMVVLLIAGIVLLATSGSVWDGSDFFVIWGFIAIIALFGLQHGFFGPQVRKAKALAERDLKASDTLSDEFEAVSQKIGQVGGMTGLLIVVTIFFMVYKPFM